MNVKGRVKAVNQKGDRYGVNIDNVWYNAFGDCPVLGGDFVSVDFETKGKFHNIKGIVKIDVEEPLSREDNIHLQVCLKIASEQLRRGDGKDIPNPKQIADYARELMREVWR